MHAHATILHIVTKSSKINHLGAKCIVRYRFLIHVTLVDCVYKPVTFLTCVLHCKIYSNLLAICQFSRDWYICVTFLAFILFI